MIKVENVSKSYELDDGTKVQALGEKLLELWEKVVLEKQHF